MTDCQLDYKVTGGVGVLRFSRPPINTVRYEDLDAIRELLERLPEADEFVVVLTTGGDDAFLAGHDVSEFIDPDGLAESERARRYVSVLRTIYEHQLVTVAAVDGPAMGGGTIIASVCDVCIASPDASFALAEIDVGIVGGYAPLKRVLPDGVARHMLYSGEPISGARAYQLGMVAVLDEAPRDRAVRYATDIASKSPQAIRAARSLARELQPADPINGYRRERDYVATLRQYDSTEEAARAFLENRPPEFGEEDSDTDGFIPDTEVALTEDDDTEEDTHADG